ncbi:hypothetical protein ABPG72_020037 [Tetrahymena utriculariae]
MPTRQNRRASKGKPQSSTTFDNKKNKPYRNGQTRKGKSRSQTPQSKRKQSTSSWSSFNSPKRYSRQPSWSNSTTSMRSYKSKKQNLSMRSNRNVLHPNTCKFWNKSQRKKGKEYVIQNSNQKIICHQNNNDQMVDESYNIKNNTQQHSISKNDLKMEEEIDMSISNKKKLQEQKDLFRKTSGGKQSKQQQEQTSPTSINLTTIQQEIIDLPQVTLIQNYENTIQGPH